MNRMGTSSGEEQKMQTPLGRSQSFLIGEDECSNDASLESLQRPNTAQIEQLIQKNVDELAASKHSLKSRDSNRSHGVLCDAPGYQLDRQGQCDPHHERQLCPTLNDKIFNYSLNEEFSTIGDSFDEDEVEAGNNKNNLRSEKQIKSSKEHDDFDNSDPDIEERVGLIISESDIKDTDKVEPEKLTVLSKRASTHEPEAYGNKMKSCKLLDLEDGSLETEDDISRTVFKDNDDFDEDTVGFNKGDLEEIEDMDLDIANYVVSSSGMCVPEILVFD